MHSSKKVFTVLWLILFLCFSTALFSNEFSKQGRIRIYSKGFIKVNGDGTAVLTTNVARGKVYVFPLPAMPPSGHPSAPQLSYYTCKRVSIEIYPYGNDPTKSWIDGSTHTSGGCTPGTVFRPGGGGVFHPKPSPETVEVQITMTDITKNYAKNLCKRLNPGGGQTKFLKLNFTARLKMKFCFLDMRGKMVNGSRVWETDCGNPIYTRTIEQNFTVPVSIECAKK